MLVRHVRLMDIKLLEKYLKKPNKKTPKKSKVRTD